MERQNNPRGAPSAPQIPPVINLSAILMELVQAMTTLTDASIKSLANSLSKTKVVWKPFFFKRDHKSDVCWFLTAYQI